MARCKINRYHLAKALHGRVIVRLIRATASPNGGNRPCALQTARNHSHASWTAKRNVAQHSGHRRKRKSAAPLWSWLQNGSNNTLTMKTFFFQSFTVFIQHSSCCWLRAISLTINPDWAARKSERAGECWWRATVHPLLLPVSTPCMGTMQKDGGHRQDRSWSVELVRVKELYHQGNPEMCLRWAGEVPFFPNQNPHPAFRLGLILDGKHFSN